MHEFLFWRSKILLYRIGTEHEFPTLANKLPERVLTEILRGIVILDAEYGADRNYLLEGGYSLIVESTEDISQLKDIIDFDTHPCEWATRIGRDTGYLSALYLLNDDFSIMVYTPIAIAPDTILKDLED